MAQDCVQEAFLNAFAKIESFDARSPLKTWLHKITVNQVLMKRRKMKPRAEESIDEHLPTFDRNGFLIGPIDVEVDNAETILSKKENAKIIRDAIDELPDSYRTILLLRDIEELTTSEVAILLEISEGILRVRLHRARSALRKKLEPLFNPKFLDDH